jgi:short/branched chain acyl-CoA dehydrogenase
VNFDLSKEHELIRDTVREFAQGRVAPLAEELDREQRFPYELVAEAAELGLMGIPVPEEYGGAGADTLSYAIAVEELTRVDSSFAITVAAHTSLGTMPILLFGTEEQKQQWLPELAAGKKLAAFGLTEPGAGSDAGATRTTAELRDGRWVVDGSKIFITNAGTDITACVTITARTGEDEISNLIVPNGTPGYEISAPMHKLGWRASDTRELSFQGAAVPEGNLLGERGQGFKQFLEILDGGRISVAAMGVGLAQGAYDQAQAYALDRQQFGRARAGLQGGVAQGRGPRLRAPGGDGEALHRRALTPRGEQRAADPRRLRLRGGVGDRPLLPRPEDPRDRRGDERGPAHGDRAAPRPSALVVAQAPEEIQKQRGRPLEAAPHVRPLLWGAAPPSPAPHCRLARPRPHGPIGLSFRLPSTI